MSVTDTSRTVKIAEDLTRAPAPQHKDLVFDVQGVGVSYDGNLAVREVSLPIYSNEVTAIIGPSGCGKSTFIRCFNRMNDLVPGAKVHGKCCTTARISTETDVDPVEVRRRIGMVFQKPNPFPEVDLRQRRLRAARARAGGRTSTSASSRRCGGRRSGTRSRTG